MPGVCRSRTRVVRLAAAALGRGEGAAPKVTGCGRIGVEPGALACELKQRGFRHERASCLEVKNIHTIPDLR